MTTLKDIKDYMLSKLSKWDKPQMDEGYYDDDGHCGRGLFLMIEEFWENFETDEDFKYLVSAKWAGDLDLEGARDYLLSDDKLLNMIFDYMYNTLNWSKSDYERIIYNSLTFTDELEWKYDDPSVVRDEKIKNITEKQEEPRNIWKGYNFNDYVFIPKVIKYPKSMKEYLDTIDSISYLGESVVDNNFILYKIKSLGVKIPKGYQIVEEINQILNQLI